MAYGGGGGFRSVRRYSRSIYGRRRAQRYKRVSRKIVAGALETKYHPDQEAHVGGTYHFGQNTTGNLCEDDSSGNVGAAYFCPLIFENNGGILAGITPGDKRISNVHGNKIWLKSVRLNCAFENGDSIKHSIRVCVFQYHDWADLNPASTGDAHFAKKLVPFGVEIGAAGVVTPSIPFGLFPSLVTSGKFTILYDLSFTLDASSTTSGASSKWVSIRLNKGFKRLLELDEDSNTGGTGFQIWRNPIVACFYANYDNDAHSIAAPRVDIECRVAYKDV